MKKRAFAMALSLCLLVGLLPTVALAEEAASPTWTGEGTSEAPYQITDKEDLVVLATSVNGGNRYSETYFKLTTDIDLENEEWTPIGSESKPFQGIFDGDNHTISNLLINDPTLYCAGLFGYLSSPGALKNLKINNASVTAKNYVGTLVGSAATGTVSNITVMGNLQITGYYKVGGLTGNAYAAIENCVVDGADGSKVTGNHTTEKDLEGDNVGGLVGFRGEGTSPTTDCAVKNVTVTGTRKVGGLIGSAYHSNVITGCFVENTTVSSNATTAYATNKADSMCIGGLVGIFNTHENPGKGTLSDCHVQDITLTAPDGVTAKMGYISGGLRGNVGVDGSFPVPTEAQLTVKYVTGVGDNTGSTVPGSQSSSAVLNGVDAWAAQVDGVEYVTLAAAVAAAGKGDTVTLLDNIYLTKTVEVDEEQNITLDLAGKAITVQKSGERSLYAIESYGRLTIQDSDGAGTITARGIRNLENGVMVINSGTFVACDGNGGAAIWNEADLTVNGGTFETVYVGTPNDTYGAGCLNNSGTALITRGTFRSVNRRTYVIISTGEMEITPATEGSVTVSGAHGGLASDGGTLVVNGGTYTSSEFYGLYVSNDGKGNDPMQAMVTVNGGTFDGKAYSVWIGSDRNNPVNSTIAINGGAFEKPLNAQDVTREGAIVVYGGTFAADPSEYVADTHGWTMEGGKYVVKPLAEVAEAKIGDTLYRTLGEAFKEVQNGQEIVLLKDVTAPGVLFNKAGVSTTLNLNGKTFTADLNAFKTGGATGGTTQYRNIKVTAGTLTVKNGTLDARNNGPTAEGDGKDGHVYGTVRASDGGKAILQDLNLYNDHIWGMSVKADPGSTIEMQNCKVYSTRGAGGMEAAGGTINVTGCTFDQKGKNGSFGYIATGIAASYNGIVNATNTSYSVEGQYAVYIYSTGATININGGTYTGVTDVLHIDTPVPDKNGKLWTEKSVINVSGGSFTGAIYVGEDKNVTVNDVQKTTSSELNITGGTFSADPSVYVTTGESPTLEVVKSGEWFIVREKDEHKHDYADATCTAPKACRVCGLTEGNSTLPHNWGVAATCTTPQTCTRCGAVNGDLVAHKIADEEIAATCTKRGYTTHTCSVCGYSYVDTYVNTVAHRWGDGVETVKATTDTSGVMTYTCGVCKATRTEEIPIQGHDFGQSGEQFPATCTTQGYTLHTCSTCEALGKVHTYHDTIVPALGHNYTGSETIAPTCTTRGYTIHSCSRCGDSYMDTYINAKGHTWDEGKVTKVPTAENSGIKTFTCQTPGCGVTRTEEVAAYGHTFAATVTPPNCVEQGYTTFNCVNCTGSDAHSYQANFTPARGHTMTSEVTKPTCTTQGFTTLSCTVCTYKTVGSFVDPIPHSYVVNEGASRPADSDNNGFTQYECSVCGDSYQVPIPAKGHTFTTKVTAPDCTTPGYTTFTCTNAGEDHTYQGDFVPATGHNWQVEGAAVSATCKSGGYTNYKCQKCQATKIGKQTAMTAHTFKDGVCSVCKVSDLTKKAKELVPVEEKLGQAEFNKLPEELQKSFENDKALKTAMVQQSKLVSDRPQDKAELVNVALMLEDTGEYVTANNFPEEGCEVTISYPQGTNRNRPFVVSHMLSSTYNGNIAGYIEYLPYEHDPEGKGIRVRVHSLSPILLAWDDQTAPPPPSSGSSGSGSSSTTTETTTNPDGSKTTTVTDKKTGTVTETTKFKDGSTLAVETKKDGTVTTTETRADKVEVKTVDKPGEAVTAAVTLPKGVETAAVTVPATVTPGTVAVDARTGEVVKLSVPTEDGLLVKLDASAELVLEDRSKDFADTPGHWAEDAVDFAVAHGMFNGTTETTFAPESPMTRAMLMTVLARFDGQNTDGGTTWFEKGMEWAKATGVSDGTNPDGSITREQLATMLYRYAGSPAVDGKLDGFTDADQVSGYAADAMAWAVSTGIIGGMGDGTLAPQNNATRAQVATMLMRFVVNMTK